MPWLANGCASLIIFLINSESSLVLESKYREIYSQEVELNGTKEKEIFLKMSPWLIVDKETYLILETGMEIGERLWIVDWRLEVWSNGADPRI